MKNRIDAKLRQLEEKAGLKKNRLKIFVRGFGEPEPVTDDEHLNIIVQRFSDPSLDYYNPGPVVLPEKPNLDEEIALLVNQLKTQGYDDRQILAMVETRQTEPQKPIDRGLYPSKDRKDRWM